jgi:hypothetical protein
MNCPNPNCNTKNLPDEARFCPECGTMLHKEELAKKMTITECRLVPNLLKQGEQCKLQWKGTAVKTIVVDNIQYNAEREIYVTPTQSRTYYIGFIGENGQTIHDQVNVLVQNPAHEERKVVVNTKPEKTSRIVFMKKELSRINAYDSGLRGLELRLNGKCIIYTEMRPYCSKEIVVKKGDVVELVADPDSDTIMFSKTLFETKVTDDTLSKSEYYLEYIKKMWVTGEVDFHAASYA